MNLYTVVTEEGIIYEGVFAPTKLEAAKQVATSMDDNDDVLEVHRLV